MGCKNKNSEGDEERKNSEHASDRNHIQQAANVALNGTVGSSGYICSPVNRKRSHEDALGVRIQSEGSMPKTQYQLVCFLTSKLFDQHQLHRMHDAWILRCIRNLTEY